MKVTFILDMRKYNKARSLSKCKYISLQRYTLLLALKTILSLNLHLVVYFRPAEATFISRLPTAKVMIARVITAIKENTKDQHINKLVNK